MSFLELPNIVQDERKIIHVDMDAFYASIEEREHPEYKKKALVIAHNPLKHNGHGVITTANYRARKYGVGSAMPAMRAVEQIPKDELVFIDPDFELFRSVSDQIHQIFTGVTDQWEPIALDEAYLDVTTNKLNIDDPVLLALKIQRKIKRELHLTCSVGVSYNMFLAKMASDYAKPFGRTVVTSDQAMNFLARMPIKKFHGIGKTTQKKLQAMKIETGQDLQGCSLVILTKRFGKLGYAIYQRSRGIDNRPVEGKRVSKSIGKERTFNRPVFNDQEIKDIFHNLSKMVAQSLQRKRLHGQTVVVKVRTTDFQTFTRRKTLSSYTMDSNLIEQTSEELFDQLALKSEPLRLLGVTVTNLVTQNFEELNLF